MHKGKRAKGKGIERAGLIWSKVGLLLFRSLAVVWRLG